MEGGLSREASEGAAIKTWKTWAGGMNLMYIDDILMYLARFLDNV